LHKAVRLCMDNVHTQQVVSRHAHLLHRICGGSAVLRCGLCRRAIVWLLCWGRCVWGRATGSRRRPEALRRVQHGHSLRRQRAPCSSRVQQLHEHAPGADIAQQICELRLQWQWLQGGRVDAPQ
jgi:hypothetical protein